MKKIFAMLLALALICCVSASPAAFAQGETYAIVPKSAGNPYMERMTAGFRQACEELGAECVSVYPGDVSPEAQISVINSLIAKEVDAIAVAANDACAISNALEEAQAEGIVVVTMDSDSEGSQLFVNQANTEEIAWALAESCYDVSGGEGEFAVLSASASAANQNLWIAAMKELIGAESERYGKLKWVATVYGDDEHEKSYAEAEMLLNDYPELKCICCPTTVGIRACCEAVKAVGSSVKVVGLGLPSQMSDYVGEGRPCPYMYLWNPMELGYCSAYVINSVICGETQGKVGESFTAGNGKEYTVTENDICGAQITVGSPFRFDENNIAEWAKIY